jgi:hypothetical protein
LAVRSTPFALLRNTVRVHRKLLQAGGVAELPVFEGHSHAQYTSAPDAGAKGAQSHVDAPATRRSDVH